MIVELVTFRPRADADPAALRAADAAVQAFAHRRPGIVRRTVAVGADGEWLVLSLWQDLAAAEGAADAAVDDPACAAFIALAQPTDFAVRRYEDLGG